MAIPRSQLFIKGKFLESEKVGIGIAKYQPRTIGKYVLGKKGFEITATTTTAKPQVAAGIYRTVDVMDTPKYTLTKFKGISYPGIRTKGKPTSELGYVLISKPSITKFDSGKIGIDTVTKLTTKPSPALGVTLKTTGKAISKTLPKSSYKLTTPTQIILPLTTQKIRQVPVLKQQPVQEVKTTQVPVLKQQPVQEVKTTQVPVLKQFQTLVPISTTITKQKQFQYPVLKQKQLQQQVTTTMIPTIPITPITPPTKFGFFMLPPWLPRLGGRVGRTRKTKKARQPKRYVPSLTALGLNIKAFKIPKSYTMGAGGLGIRPILISHKRK